MGKIPKEVSLASIKRHIPNVYNSTIIHTYSQSRGIYDATIKTLFYAGSIDSALLAKSIFLPRLGTQKQAPRVEEWGRRTKTNATAARRLR